MMRTRTRPRHAAPRKHRLLPLIVAGAVALLVALVCGGLLLSSAGQAPPGTPTTEDPPPSPTGGPGGAEGTPAAPTDPDAVPTGLEFEEHAGVPLPVSAVAGPRDRTGGLARGFSRDPTGVALAAAHILIRVHPEVGADVFGPTVAAQVTGPYADALGGNVHHGYDLLLHSYPVPYGQPASALHFTVEGFRVEAFTVDEATVRLLLDVPAQQESLLGATTVQMRWHHGDWALVAPPDGVFAATVLVEDTTGFTFWREATGP